MRTVNSIRVAVLSQRRALGLSQAQVAMHAGVSRKWLSEFEQGKVTAELGLPDGAEIVGGPNRVQLGQLSGRSSYRLNGGTRSDGTPDRVSAKWIVRGGAEGISVVASHPRAGTRQRLVVAVATGAGTGPETLPR